MKVHADVMLAHDGLRSANALENHFVIDDLAVAIPHYHHKRRIGRKGAKIGVMSELRDP